MTTVSQDTTSTNGDNQEHANLSEGKTNDSQPAARPSSGRGFASMDPKRQREIASEGGKAAHASGHANKFTSASAREAGRKGGQASGGQRRKA